MTQRTYAQSCSYPDVRNVAGYICQEIKTNVQSLNTLAIGMLNTFGGFHTIKKNTLETVASTSRLLLSIPKPLVMLSKATSQGVAYGLWAERVAKQRPWDHKKPIRDKFGEWSCDHTRGFKFYFDIWSNIHYGYVGRYAGFSEYELSNAAGIAQIRDNSGSRGRAVLQKIPEIASHIAEKDVAERYDDPCDAQAVRVGYSLFYKFGAATQTLTAQDILNELYLFYENHKPLSIEKCENHG